ncbi:MAG: ice-binding family protein [Acidobacteriota bacterium]
MATKAAAQVAPSLGAAQPFAVLAGSTVVSPVASTVTGNIGLSPGSSVVGFPPGIVLSGIIHAADAPALNAQNDATAAYLNVAGQPCTADLTGQDLGGLTLTPGVYCFSSSAGLTGTLTLDGQGNPAAVFLFKSGSTLTTASAASVLLIGNASACNVFWQVGSSATLGTGTSFQGNILALASITLNSGTVMSGRALAQTGATTIDASTLTAPCLTALPSCPAIALTPATLLGGTVGVAYAASLTASGGFGVSTFAVTTGSPPAGLTLTPAGVLAGTPTTAATATFTGGATDQNSCSGNLAYVIVIAAAPPVSCPTITLSPASLPTAILGIAYSQLLTASGGTGPYLFSLASGALPPGIALGSAGGLSGTATGVGLFSPAIRGTDVNGCFTDPVFALAVAAAVPTLPQTVLLVLAVGLAGAGYIRLRRRRSI